MRLNDGPQKGGEVKEQFSFGGLGVDEPARFGSRNPEVGAPELRDDRRVDRDDLAVDAEHGATAATVGGFCIVNDRLSPVTWPTIPWAARGAMSPRCDSPLANAQKSTAPWASSSSATLALARAIKACMPAG